MKSNVFSPTAALKGGKKGTLQSVALVDKIIVPHLPKGSTDETRRAFLFLIMCSGTSSRTSLNEWKVFIATYTVALFPGMLSKLPASIFTLTPLEETQVGIILTTYQGMVSALRGRDEVALSATIAQLGAGSPIPGFPTPDPALDWKTANGQWATKIVISHYSIVLFLVGKRIEGDDHSAITTARPDAVKKKAHLSGVMGFLDGPLRLSDTSHNLINNAWAELSSLRALVMSEFAKFGQSDTDFSQDMVYTTMHLLRWGAMTHAKITMDFVRAYPWVASVPQLRASLSVFIESVRALEKVDPLLRPYVKLIYGDKSSVFPRKELEPLVACAVDVATEVSETLTAFYVSNAYQPIVDAFNEERARRERIRDAELAAREQELHILEEEEEVEEQAEMGIQLPEEPDLE